MFLRAIRKKVEGKADDAVHKSGDSLNWDEIKGGLILHCSDKRDEKTRMFNCKTSRILNFQYKPYLEKFCEIITILFKLTNTIEHEPILIKTKKELFANTCITTLLKGITVPFGLAVRSIRPVNLQEAFEWAIKERDI